MNGLWRKRAGERVTTGVDPATESAHVPRWFDRKKRVRTFETRLEDASVRASDEVSVDGTNLGLGQRRREPLPAVAVGEPVEHEWREAGFVRQIRERAVAQAGLDGGVDGGDGVADGGVVLFLNDLDCDCR
jgi:hypothetical protein